MLPLRGSFALLDAQLHLFGLFEPKGYLELSDRTIIIGRLEMEVSPAASQETCLDDTANEEEEEFA
ncbi:hypothetical protein EDM53_05925 [Rickettsiales endosymbiont of Peranema trichophorum]|uniref:hypothetical protein n=1 Tax=Rickettsiales endosymbiont of Peranema trichophorum TaxID=2486577 RepID=UPI0010235462|nr:hypothetical protein [Rickettsiales endosymbiont of Peranema trichophorum]RZI45080.1 hypothetical protein EDM53_05925 [Rickettsiales endosymbiont of Peranema trichophorum]